MSARFPLKGEIFEGRYRVEAPLGSGGFARVYKATEVAVGREVALKLLAPPTIEGQSDAERETYRLTLVERFHREAQVLSRLRSPYTITMFHFGESKDGMLYMALEYIDGLSLSELLADSGPIAAPRTVRILRQVLLSLHEAHGAGLLHRDLKPANIMIYDHLGESDHVKLLDFGIAKALSNAPIHRKDLTSAGTMIGTPRYMAPEQIRPIPEGVGPAADLYALGLVAFELLVGRRAIEDDNSIQIIGHQLAPESFVLPIEARVPPRLRAIVNKMMEKNLKRRYVSTTDILDDLKHPQLLEFDGADGLDEESLTEPTTVMPSPFARGATQPQSPVRKAALQPVPQSIPPVVTWAALAVSLVALAAALLSTPKSSPEPSQTVAAVNGGEPQITYENLLGRGQVDEAHQMCLKAESAECLLRVGNAYIENGNTKLGCELIDRAGGLDDRCPKPTPP